jgi:hypothetical protein
MLSYLAALALAISSLFVGASHVGAQGISQLQQWKTGGSGTYIQPSSSTVGLLVPGLATSTTGCLSVRSNGWISASGSACGAGSGGSSIGEAWTIQGNGYLAPTTTKGIIVAASSTIGAGGAATGLTVNGGATTTKPFTLYNPAGAAPIVTLANTASNLLEIVVPSVSSVPVFNIEGGQTVVAPTLRTGFLTIRDAFSGFDATFDTGLLSSSQNYIFPQSGGTFCISGINCPATTTANTWSAFNKFTYGIFATLASSTNATTTNLHITGLATPAGAVLAVDPNGKVIATTTAPGGVTSVSGTFPVQSTGGNTPAISLAFGTTTKNDWNAHNTFTSLFATNATTTNATTTSLYFTGLTSGGLAVDSTGRVYKAATTTAGTGLTYDGTAFNVTLGTSIDLTSEVTGDLPFSSLAQVSANSVLGNNSSATADAASISTTTLYGPVQNGKVLTGLGGLLQYVATTTFSAPFVYSAGNVTCTSASAGVTGCLTGTDWSTFNNKQTTISATYPITLTGAAVLRMVRRPKTSGTPTTTSPRCLLQVHRVPTPLPRTCISQALQQQQERSLQLIPMERSSRPLPQAEAVSPSVNLGKSPQPTRSLQPRLRWEFWSPPHQLSAMEHRLVVSPSLAALQPLAQ